MGTLPRPLDFAVVGAAKSGTSSFSALLHQHPDLHVLQPKDSQYFAAVDRPTNWTGPRDEIFNDKARAAIEEFPKQVSRVPQSTRIGDISVFYMTDRSALRALAADLSDEGFVIAVLRRPDDRAYSAYMHMVREGLEKHSFADGLALEERRRAEGWQPIWWYKSLGYYSRQIKDLYEIFGRDRVAVLEYESLTKKTRETVEPILERLGTAWHDTPLIRNNASGVPKNLRFQRFLSDPSIIKSVGSHVIPRQVWLRLRRRMQAANLTRVPMSIDDRMPLMEEYESDIGRLEQLTGINLSAWREIPSAPSA